MITSLTSGELLLAGLILILTTWELAQLSAARRAGRTKNISRVVTHGLAAIFMLVYIGYVLYWWQIMVLTPYEPPSSPVGDVNWPILILGIVLGLILVQEIVSHLRAVKLGLTTNMSRLLLHIVMVVALAALLALSVAKWELYLEQLESTYRQAIPTQTSSDG